MQIDLRKLKRIPTTEDINKASEELLKGIENIVYANDNFFIVGNYPKKIDYIIVPYISSESGIIQYPYPQVSFLDLWLPDKIKKETTVKFYELLFRIVNDE